MNAKAQPDYRDIITNALGPNNVGLVQLLGLCPLLAVTTTVTNGLGLGLATLIVLCCSNTLVSLSRHSLRREIRIPAYVLIIASLVTTVELVLEAYFPELNQRLGIFVPLIVTNCAIVARAEVFASRNPAFASLVDGFATGVAFLLVLVAVGAIRELIGNGSLFSDLHLLTGGDPIAGIQFTNHGLLIAILPPGAFFALALVIVLNKLRLEKKHKALQKSINER